MIASPDLAIVDALTSGLQYVREVEPDVLFDIFASRPKAEQTDIREYFLSKTIPVNYGYPRQDPTTPAYYVVLGSTSEDVAKQTIGGDYPDDGSSFVIGTQFISTVRIVCLASNNAFETFYLGMVANWILLNFRLPLELEFGFMNQSLNMTDMQPKFEWIPDVVFRRDVIFQANHEDTAVTPNNWPKISQINVVPTAEVPEYTVKFAIGHKAPPRRQFLPGEHQ